MASITLKNISKWFSDNQVIKNIDLNIRDGEFVVFVGEDLEGLYTLIDVNQKEIVFRNEDKLYKITNLVGKSKK